LRQSLAMPDMRGYERLIAAAQAMAERAAEHRDRFVEAGFGETFVDQVKHAALELQKTIDAKAAHFGHRAAATSGMVQELSRGRALVRLLDALSSGLTKSRAPRARACMNHGEQRPARSHSRNQRPRSLRISSRTSMSAASCRRPVRSDSMRCSIDAVGIFTLSISNTWASGRASA
jgi:hypothetical protein